MHTDRLAIRFLPADPAEGFFRFLIRHAEDLSEAQGPGRLGLEEVEGHNVLVSENTLPDIISLSRLNYRI